MNIENGTASVLDKKLENDKNNLDTDKLFKIIEGIKAIIKEDSLQKQPLFLKIDETFLLQLIKKILLNSQKTYLIGITGESASGKTTFVNNVAQAFHNSSSDDLFTTISCDDYYFDTSEDLKEAGGYEALFSKGFSLDTPNAINLELMKAHLVSLKNNCGVYAPYYDFVTCQSTPSKIYKKPSRIILNEGLYVLNQNVLDVHDVKVYVFTPFNIIKERWYKRAQGRGKTGTAADLQFEDVNRTAQVYIRPTMQEADIVLNGVSSAQYIEEITYKILSFLKSVE